MPGSSDRSVAAGRPWRCRDRVLTLGVETRIMGILNVTPDSFSDGGAHPGVEDAVAHGRRMEEDGADLIDVGGESTRPGAAPVQEAEERDRVLPVIEKLAPCLTGLVSIDTTKAGVARAAVAAGAHVINDVSAMTADPAMVGVAAETGAGVVLMHRQGTPATMQAHPVYEDVVTEVCGYLRDRAGAVIAAGVHPEAIVLDPGIGFGKTLDHNLALLRGLPALRALGFPVLVGASRKRLLGDLLGRPVHERRAGSLGLLAWAVSHGADVVRVHDVKESCDVAGVLDKLARHEE